MTLYDRIKNASIEYEITITELEKNLGFSNGTIGKWKDAIPYADRLLAVAEYFGTSVEYLMTGKEVSVSKHNNVLTNSINESPNSHLFINESSKDLTKQELELLLTYRELGIKEQAELVTFMLNLKK